MLGREINNDDKENIMRRTDPHTAKQRDRKPSWLQSHSAKPVRPNDRRVARLARAAKAA